MTCSKCNFNLKGAAAPKFKGTMLMMNQQGAAQTPAPPGAVPQAPAGAAPQSAPPRPSNPGPGPAAPSKLKGTMVGVAPPMAPVMGKPGAPVAAPAAYAPATPNAFGMPMDQAPAPPPPPPPAYGAPQQGFGAPPQQQAPQGFGAPPPQQAPQGFGAPQQGFGAPPQQQQFGGGQGVNPLGGTMVAEQNAYAGNPYGAAQAPPPAAYGAPPQQAYGAPPQQQAYGAPPQQQAYGAPPQQAFGAPPPDPGAYGAGGYGQPQQQAYGAPLQQQAYGAPPQQQAYGAPPGAMQQQPMGMGGAMQPGGAAGGLIAGLLVGGTKPTTRNPMKTLLVPFGLFFAGIVVSILFGIIAGVTGVAIIGMLGGLLSLVCFMGGAALMLITLIKMVNEVKSVTRNDAFAWWPIFVPLYSLYWMLILLPQEVTNAKRTVGLQQPARSLVHYWFIAPYALAADINEIAARTG